MVYYSSLLLHIFPFIGEVNYFFLYKQFSIFWGYILRLCKSFLLYCFLIVVFTFYYSSYMYTLKFYIKEEFSFSLSIFYFSWFIYLYQMIIWTLFFFYGTSLFHYSMRQLPKKGVVSKNVKHDFFFIFSYNILTHSSPPYVIEFNC